MTDVLRFPADSKPAQRIRDRAQALRRHLAYMAEVNRLLATNDIQGLRALGFADTQIAWLQTPDSLGCAGFSERTFVETEAKLFQLEAAILPITRAPRFDGRG